MLVPLSWLRDYVAWEASAAELAEILTLAGVEVEARHAIGDWWDPDAVKVGQVVGVQAHPQADRLVLVDVDDGAEAPERVVTGAPNLFAFRGRTDLPPLKVAFARVGAELVDAYADERPRPRKKLKASRIRGVKSSGMVCSERELGLSEEHEGILLLPDDAPVGAPLNAYLRDDILELDLTPDMARCLSLVGVAREVSALAQGRPLDLELSALPSCDAAAEEHPQVALAIDDPDLCPRYVAAIVRDVQVGPSPAWMQQRLTRAGMRPVNNIVDITNYVMLEWGQPLHAFDYERLLQRSRAAGADKPCIRMRTARDGETLTTLDGATRALRAGMLLITDRQGPIALAGVMGGADTEVSAATTTVLLESATFDGINNRRTAQALRLHSEASHRFTRGVPATLNPLAASRAARLMGELAGGVVAEPLADAYPRPQERPIIWLTASEVNRQLGMRLSLDAIQDALRSLDIDARPLTAADAPAPAPGQFGLRRNAQEPTLVCAPPWHRLDLRLPADLTEEVARVVGYDQVGYTQIADASPLHAPHPALDAEDRIRDALSGLGLQEWISYAYSSRDNHAKLARHAGDAPPGPFVELQNPSAPERSVMRRDLLVSALENLAFNLRFAPRLAAYEIGLEYLPEAGTPPYPLERRALQLILTGPRALPHFETSGDEAAAFDYFDLKGVLETLFDRLNLAADVRFEAAQDPRYGPYCARIVLRGEPVGLAGELHPRVRQAFQLPAVRIAIARLDVEPLAAAPAAAQMTPLSPYPAVVEDLAFQVDMDVPAQRVADAVRAGGGAQLARAELFDLYQGAPLPPGKKSLAFQVAYQSLTRNLGEKETTRIRRKIAQAVARAVGGELRAG